MFQSIKNLGISAHFLLAAAGISTMTAGSALADPGVEFRISWGQGHVQRQPVYVGTLVIDGRAFVIDTRGSIQKQIEDAFECMGYDAWCIGGSVRINTECWTPDVGWYNGRYGMTFRERRTTLTLTPGRCVDFDNGHGYRYQYGYRGADEHFRGYTSFSTGTVIQEDVTIGLDLDNDDDRGNSFSHDRIVGSGSVGNRRDHASTPSFGHDDAFKMPGADPRTSKPAPDFGNGRDRTTDVQPKHNASVQLKPMPQDPVKLEKPKQSPLQSAPQTKTQQSKPTPTALPLNQKPAGAQMKTDPNAMAGLVSIGPSVPSAQTTPKAEQQKAAAPVKTEKSKW